MALKIGAQLYTVRDFCQTLPDFSDTLAKIADLGFSCVQVSGTCDYDPDWLAQELRKNGLTCAITHIELPDIVRDPEQLVKDHARFGCSHIGIGYMPPEYRGSTEKVTAFCDTFADAAKRIRACGAHLMYHNHAFEYEDRGDGKNYMEMISDRFPADELGFTLDTYWVAYGGYDVLSEIRRLSGRLPCVHLKDMEILPDGTRRYCPVGAGILDFPAILSAFEAAGTEYAFIEQDECFGRDPFDCLSDSLSYLRSLGLN